MKPNETAASYSLRFGDQLSTCLDAHATLHRDDCLHAAFAGLPEEYDGLRSVLSLKENRNWASTWTLPDQWEEVIAHEEHVVLPIRARQKAQQALVSNAAVSNGRNPNNKSRNKSPSSKTANARTGGSLCLLLGRDGNCSRRGCRYNHNDPAACADEYKSFMSRHKCSQFTLCTEAACFWPVKPAAPAHNNSQPACPQCIVAELKKTLCGIREASRSFFEVLRTQLLRTGLQQSKIDKCLFYRTDEHGNRVVAYVDDLLIMATRPEDTTAVVNPLKSYLAEVTVKDGTCISFLGMEIATDSNGQCSVPNKSTEL